MASIRQRIRHRRRRSSVYPQAEPLEARRLLVATPVAVVDSATTNPGVAVTIDLLLNDTDADGDPLQIANLSNQQNGTVMHDGRVATFMPSPGFTGTGSFSYTVTDGVNESVPVDVSVIVAAPGNAAPTPNARSFSGIDEDNPFSVMGIGLLSGATDPDGDSLSVIAVNGNTTAIGNTVTLPSGATLQVTSTGPFDYRPESSATLNALGANESATDRFTFTIGDGQGGIATATVSITVDGVNDAPTAVADTANVGENGPAITIAVRDNDSDPDTSNMLVVTSVTQGTQGGSVTLNSGTVMYDPNGRFESLADGQTDTDTFSYTVSDGYGGTSSAAVTVTVNGANDPPAITPGQACQVSDLAPQGRTVCTVEVNDPDNDAFMFSIVSGNPGAPSNGLFAINASTGAVTVNNPALLSLGATHQLEIEVADAGGLTDRETISIMVANQAPIATDNTAQVVEDTQTTDTGNLLTDDDGAGVDRDADQDPITVAEVAGNTSPVSPVQGTFGALVWATNGIYTYTLNNDSQAVQALAAGETATDVFPYRVTDSSLSSVPAMLTVTVTGVNDVPVATQDQYSIDEQSLLSGNVIVDDTGSGRDSDADAMATLTVASVNGNSGNVGQDITTSLGATLRLNSDGSFTYDWRTATNPDAIAEGEARMDSFTYAISDGQAASNEATVVLTITGVNDAPTAVNNGYSTGDNVPISQNVITDDTGAGRDSDPDASDMLQVAQVNGQANLVGVPFSLPSGATLRVNADGSVQYDPTTSTALLAMSVGEQATESFSYVISDGNGGTGTAMVTIRVDGVNEAPTATPNQYQANEDSSPITGNVLTDNTGAGVDSDRDRDQSDPNDVLAVASFVVNGVMHNVGDLVQLPSGASLQVQQNGNFVYDYTTSLNALAEGEVNEFEFSYTVSDGNGGTASAPVTLTVTGVNDAPVATGNQYVIDENTLSFTGNVITDDTGSGRDSDPDVNGTPPDDLFTVFEVNGDETLVGRPIVLAGTGATLQVNRDGSFTYDRSTVANPDALVLGETQLEMFTYRIFDGRSLSATLPLVMIRVNGLNDAPSAVGNQYATQQGESVSGNVISDDTGSGVDSDPDIDGTPPDDPLTVKQVNGQMDDVGRQIVLPSGATLSLNANGTFQYDPSGSARFNALAVGQTDVDSFTYTVTDSHDGMSTATVMVTVTGTNDDVVARPNQYTTNEATLVSGNLITDDTGSGVDSDGDTGDSLRVIGLTINGAVAAVGTDVTLDSGAMLRVNQNGSFTYDPSSSAALNALAAGEQTVDPPTFSYTLSDGNGSTDTATVSIVVNGLNDAPRATNNQYATNEDTLRSGNVITDETGSGQDSDPDVNGTVPNDQLTVQAVNGNSEDVGRQITLASGATLKLDADGRFDYDPRSSTTLNALGNGQTAMDSFTYTVTDGNGGLATATVMLAVAGANDRPVAQADAQAVDEDQLLNVAAVGVLSNDTDPEGDRLTVSSADRTSARGAAVWVNADGSLTYDPRQASELQALRPGQTKTDTFSYTVSDGNGGADQATVMVTVTGRNDRPTATDNTAGVVEDGAQQDQGNLLTDDDRQGVDADPEGDALTVLSIGGVNNPTQDVQGNFGSLAWNANGDYTYTLNNTSPQVQALAEGETRTDQFTYTVTDGNGGADQATLTVTITGNNDTPTATDNVYQTNEDQTIAGNVISDNTGAGTDSDSDVDGATPDDTLMVSQVNGSSGNVGSQFTLPSGATVMVMDTGMFVYDPAPASRFNTLVAGETATDTFTYTLSDGRGGAETAQVTVTVTGVNDAPVVENPIGDLIVELGDSLNQTIRALPDDPAPVIFRDPDINGRVPEDSLTLTAALADGRMLPAWMVFNGRHFSGVPTVDDIGEYQVRVTATDNQGASVDDVFTIEVQISTTNQAPTITSDGGQLRASLSVLENSGFVTQVTATDPDTPSQLLRYSLRQTDGGADAEEFAIDPVTGVLSFVPPPDFESPDDIGRDNVYEVFVFAEDGRGGSDFQVIAVTVLDVENEDIGLTRGSTLAGEVFAQNEGGFQPFTLSLPGIQVSLRGTGDEGQAVEANTLTQDDGTYRFNNLPAGQYEVIVRRPAAVDDGGQTRRTIVVGEEETVADVDFAQQWFRPQYVTAASFLASNLRNGPDEWGWPIRLRERLAQAEEDAGNPEVAQVFRSGQQVQFHLVGAELAVFGTAGDDQFTVEQSDSVHRLTVNGVTREFPASQVNVVRILGGGGRDTATVNGTEDNEHLDARFAWAQYSNDDFSVELHGLEEIAVDFNDRNDTLEVESTLSYVLRLLAEDEQ